MSLVEGAGIAILDTFLDHERTTYVANGIDDESIDQLMREASGRFSTLLVHQNQAFMDKGGHMPSMSFHDTVNSNSSYAVWPYQCNHNV